MKTLEALAVLALIPLATGCFSTGFPDIQVEAEAVEGVDFEGYKTYAWAMAAAVVNDPERDWTAPQLDVGAEIIYLVNRELRGEALTEVADSPDLLVMYAVGVDMKALDIVVDDEGVDRVREAPQGAVLIFLADAETRRAVWAGAAQADLLEEPSMELAKKRLDHAITEMFAKAPL